jgi:hypothetical protein
LNPLILYDNLLSDATLTATDTATTYDVNNLKNWKNFKKWMAASAGTKYITANYLSKMSAASTGDVAINGGFDPDTNGWTGTNCTLASIAGGDAGKCLEMTMTAGTTQTAWRKDIPTTSGSLYCLSIKVKSGGSGNEAFSFQAWTVVGGTVTTKLNEGSGTTSAAWVQYLFYFHAQTAFTAIYINKNTATAGTMLFDTVTCFPAMGGAVDTLGISTHNLYTASATVSVEYSDDNSSWSVALAGFTSTSDRTLLKTFTSVQAPYWRVKIVTGAIAPYMGILAIGPQLLFPSSFAIGSGPVTPHSIGIVASADVSKTGNPLGSSIRYKPITVSVTFPAQTYAWCLANLWPFFINHGSDLTPFFWAPDLTTFTGDIFLMRLTADSVYGLPMLFEDRVESIALKMEGAYEE